EHKSVKTLVDQAAPDVFEHPPVGLRTERDGTVAFVRSPDVMRRVAERHERRGENVRLPRGTLNYPARNDAIPSERRKWISVALAAADRNQYGPSASASKFLAHGGRAQLLDVERLGGLRCHKFPAENQSSLD